MKHRRFTRREVDFALITLQLRLWGPDRPRARRGHLETDVLPKRLPRLHQDAHLRVRRGVLTALAFAIAASAEVEVIAIAIATVVISTFLDWLYTGGACDRGNRQS